jgi:hypothetical protein
MGMGAKHRTLFLDLACTESVNDLINFYMQVMSDFDVEGGVPVRLVPRCLLHELPRGRGVRNASQ